MLSTMPAVREQIPNLPLAFSVLCPAHRHKESVRRRLAILHSAKIALSGIAAKPHSLEIAPHSLKEDFGAVFDPDDVFNPQVFKQLRQLHIGKAAICCNAQTATAQTLLEAANDTLDDRHFITPHTSFQDLGRIGPPINRQGAPACHKRDNQQMMVAFNRPINGQSQFAASGNCLMACKKTASARSFGDNR